MAGGRTARSDAREQLVPKGDENGDPSCSPSHAFPQYEVPLPGTIPSSSRTGAPTVIDAASNGDGIPRDLTSTGNGSMSSGLPSTGPKGAAPGVAAASELLPSPRQPMPSAGGSSTIAAMEIQEALLPLQPAAPFEHPISLPRRRWMMFMFCLVAALLYADQNLLAPNMTAAADFFGLNERQKDTLLGGALMAAFFAVGAPAALLVGWLTDRGDINRRTLLFWVVVVGETPCLLTYWVKEYWQFFLLRALTGVAVGGCFPLVFSLLGDLYPPKRRAAVSAAVQIATGIGLAAGQALSGSIGPATNWRVPFVVVAAPSLAVAVLMLLTTQEPPRGAFEEALRERYTEGLGAYEGSISWAKVAVLLRCPSNALVILQGLPGSLPWGMMLTYFNDFLAQQKGFTVQAATGVLLFFGAGGALGVIGGGAGGQWLYNKRKEYQALLAGGSVLAGIGPLYALINADLQRVGLAGSCFLAALGGLVASVAGPNLRSVMLNVNEPDTRGVALALQSMTDDLGKGLGPVLVAGLIHALGREGAFNVATAGWIPCGIMLASLACCMRRDEAAMQARLAAASEAQAHNQEAAAAAAAAADGDGGPGSGITVVLPPGTPPYGSEGGAAAAAAAASATNTIGAEADRRKEERRLAKVRLLEAADGGSSSTASRVAQLPLPLSSSCVELPAEEARWGSVRVGGGGDGGGGGGGGGGARSGGGVRAAPSALAAASAAAVEPARPLGQAGGRGEVVIRPLLPDLRPAAADDAGDSRALVNAVATTMDSPQQQQQQQQQIPPPPLLPPLPAGAVATAAATLTMAPEPSPSADQSYTSSYYPQPYSAPYPQAPGTYEAHVGVPLAPTQPPSPRPPSCAGTGLAVAAAAAGAGRAPAAAAPKAAVAQFASGTNDPGGGDARLRGSEAQDTSSSSSCSGRGPAPGRPLQGGRAAAAWEPAAGSPHKGQPTAEPAVSEPGLGEGESNVAGSRVPGTMGTTGGVWGGTAGARDPGDQDGTAVWPSSVAASLEAFWGRSEGVPPPPPPQ